MSTSFKKYGAITTIVLIGFFIRLFVLIYYGPLSLDSDDRGYVGSARRLLETGLLTYHYHDVPTIHIMPGQPLLLAALFWLTPTSDAVIEIYVAKIFFILLGTVNIYLVYLISRLFVPNKTAWIPPLLLALYIPQILTDQLFITETPFLFLLLLLVYFSIKLGQQPMNWRYFFGVILSYLGALMFKATIALYPFVLLIYFILIRYPWKQAVKQFGVALLLLILVLGPWWYRNYVQFDAFIPLTAGAGNPLLLGTYQGGGDIFYPTYDDVIEQINEENQEIIEQQHLIMEKQEEVAKQRMSKLWTENPQQFLENYVLYKTHKQWSEQFYWIEIFGLSQETINRLYNPLVPLGVISMLVGIITYKQRRKELLLLSGIIVLNTVLNSIFFAFGRYNQPFMFIWFIAIAVAITQGARWWRKWRSKR